MQKFFHPFTLVLMALFIAAPAWSAPDPMAGYRSAAGKRIVATARTEATLGFKPYAGAMLELNESIEDCADARNDRTSLIFRSGDPIGKVREFYGITARDGNKLVKAEEGRSLQLADLKDGTRIAFRLFPPKEAKPVKAAKPAKK